MEKRIILDEQDINEFHEDAAILRWIYDLMTKEYLISEHSKNMPRFAGIINKLKQLQRMKIKKIKEMNKEIFDFSEALRRMKEGKKVRREIWEECRAYIYIVGMTIWAV